HAEVLALNAEIVREEQRLGLSISQLLNEDFRGLALAWAEGHALGEIAGRARLAEGDVVGVLQKTLDLVGQLRNAAAGRRPAGQLERQRSDALLEKLDLADGLVRRGVVEASYRWAIVGPPEAATDEASSELDLDWNLAPPADRRSPRRPVRPAEQVRRGKGRRARNAEAASASADQESPAPQRRALPGRRKPPRPARRGGPPRG